MPVAVIIDSTSSFMSAHRNTFLFETREQADAVFDQLDIAVKAYSNRANDREKYVSFDHIAGRASIDVSCTLCLFVDDPEPQIAAISAWNNLMASAQSQQPAAGQGESA